MRLYYYSGLLGKIEEPLLIYREHAGLRALVGCQIA